MNSTATAVEMLLILSFDVQSEKPKQSFDRYAAEFISFDERQKKRTAVSNLKCITHLEVYPWEVITAISAQKNAASSWP